MADTRDFRQISIYPNRSELWHHPKEKPRKNIISGPFESIDHYLDIQFKLLREDFVNPVRQGLRQYRRDGTDNNITIYRSVKIVLNRLEKKHQLKFHFKSNPLDLNHPKTLRNGSLLIFTRNQFANIFLGKVVDRKEVDPKNRIFIDFVEQPPTGRFLQKSFTMAECRCLFEPYFQVLTALKCLDSHRFPFERYIVNVNTTVQHPDYLKYHNEYTVGDCKIPLPDWSKFPTTIPGLNQAQVSALKAAVSQEFVLIQGPPGTGKTHLGVQIVNILLQNRNLWYHNSPILVITLRNRTLGKFLEQLIPLTNQLVCVSESPTNNTLKGLTLDNIKKAANQDLPGSSSLEKDCSDLSILQNAMVVGLTIAAATGMKRILEMLKSPIVIIEEAAEMLEAYIVAALPSTCQHLILLGDHQQLQPMTSDSTIAKDYCLGVSLFQRMVRNGMTAYKLKVQHKIRPEISQLLKATIYPFLEDHSSVSQISSVAGVDKNVFFINHQRPEQNYQTTGRRNLFEARFTISFARYLVLNGYKWRNVIILTPYSAQVAEMNRVKDLQRSKSLENIRISTFDSYRGQEADIIILSLVRSRGYGVVPIENRISVALSRARKGLYIIGNMKVLTRRSQMWRIIENCLKEQNAIDSKIPLRCQNHPETVTHVSNIHDFRQVCNGGCSKICKAMRPCGHECLLACHILSHDSFHCKAPCNRRVCQLHVDQKCNRKCFEPCESCSVKVMKKLECGHTEKGVCSERRCLQCPSTSAQ